MKNKKLIILSIVIIVGLFAFGGWNYLKPIKNAGPKELAAQTNPQKGDFIKVGQMSVPRYNHQTVLLDDGTVLVFGGMTLRKDYEGGSFAVDLYDPNTIKFTPVSKMNELRRDFAVTKLNTGKVLITGGRIGNKSINRTEIYNPKTKFFEKGPDMNFVRKEHTATLLNNGRVLISGGDYSVYNITKRNIPNELYNPKTEKFKIAAKMKIPRFSHSAILLKDGRVLIVGGVGRNNGKTHKLVSAEIYDPKTNKFKLIGNMNIARRTPNLYLLKDGNVLISGGIKDQDKDKGMDSIYVKEIEIYNPKTNRFKIISTRTSEANDPAEVLLSDDKLLYTGSQTGVGLSLMWYKNSEIFDPKTRKFTEGKDMNFARSCHRMTLLKDGNVLITGSYNEGRTAELYIAK